MALLPTCIDGPQRIKTVLFGDKVTDKVMLIRVISDLRVMESVPSKYGTTLWLFLGTSVPASKEKKVENHT